MNGPATSSRFSTTAIFADVRAEIQFVRGLEEKTVPNVKLTRAKDGSSGVATFFFDNPNVFDSSTASQGDVTGLFMIDEEGEISTTDVNARFSNGKPQAIESVYVMKSPEEWDRFMRLVLSMFAAWFTPLCRPTNGSCFLFVYYSITAMHGISPRCCLEMLYNICCTVHRTIVEEIFIFLILCFFLSSLFSLLRFMERYGEANGLGFSKA